MTTENPNDRLYPSLSIHALFDESIDGKEPLPRATGIELLEGADVIQAVHAMDRYELVVFGNEQVRLASDSSYTGEFTLVRIDVDSVEEMDLLCRLVETVKGYCEAGTVG